MIYILIDSDVLIWILRGRSDIKDRFINLINTVENRVFITPVQIAEIYAGLREKEKIETSLFIDSLSCIPIDTKIGKLAGEYLNLYKKSHNISLADSIIGACMKLYNMKLWTLNKKHYPMVLLEDFIN